ncbi:hybrid sensor histidine kinase/response regulator [Sediminitomix flava]|uniref:histidine kinase n=1 Tax=Sediminitomix flava TaxID=379075 RepID=A0A315Z802_SEDFL|nr:response regulator [Sediminitomix flava]PWJ40987.1 phospho-acceptor domain-containing protein [Sediminitomix flava]
MKKILIVEDEESVRENISEILEVHNYETETAENGRVGIEKVFQFNPDLIICDIMMPEVDGYEVIETLREKNDYGMPPFIFLSALSDKSDLRKGMDLGADDYLSKPFRMDDLLSAIESKIKKHDRLQKDIEQQLTNNSLLLPPDTASHEFNTPLNGIMGLTNMLLQFYHNLSKDEVKEYLIEIKKSGQLLERSFRNLFLHHTISTYPSPQDAVKLFKADCVSSISKILTQTTEDLAKKYNRNNDVEFNFTEIEFPSSLYYPTLLLEEVLDNALKFSKNGDAIKISGEIEEDYYHISVVNEGSDFPQSQMNQIAPFTQFGRDKNEQQGLGLGLTLIKKIIEIMNGQISFEEIDNCTKVTIKLSLKNTFNA